MRLPYVYRFVNVIWPRTAVNVVGKPGSLLVAVMALDNLDNKLFAARKIIGLALTQAFCLLTALRKKVVYCVFSVTVAIDLITKSSKV